MMSRVSNLSETMTGSSSTIPLASLLPFDVTCHTIFLREQIKGYSFFLKALIQAVEFLTKKELDRFDPLVGDAACQIRALKLCLVTSSCIDSFSLRLPNLFFLKSKIDGLLVNPFTPKRGVLHDFLIQHNLALELSEDETFIFDSFLLTVAKRVLSERTDSPQDPTEKVDPLELRKIETSLTRNFAQNYVEKARRRLASSSVKFIRNEAQLIPDFEIASRMVSSEFTILHNRLECISCFWSIFIIVKRALQLRIPIVLLAHQKAKDLNYKIIDRTAILFKEDKGKYYEVGPQRENLDQLGIVIEGVTCRDLFELTDRKTWIRELIQHQPTDLFLPTGAMHRQYPDASKDHLIEEQEDATFLAFREKSLRLGCCLENPCFFLLLMFILKK